MKIICDDGIIALIDLVGIGTFSRCYKAQLVNDSDYYNRIVLVKQLKKVYNPNDIQLVNMIESESILLKKSLKHTNIVSLLKIYPLVPNKEILIIKEFVDGTNLEHYIHSFKTNIPLDIRLQISIQINSAIDYLHTNDIIHLDIKPANILLQKSTLTIKLTDFGSIYYCNSSKNINSRNINNNINTATIPYCAPELFTTNIPTSKCDIYSLGIVMWEMKSLCYPYETCEHRFTLIFNIVSKKLNPEYYQQLLLSDDFSTCNWLNKTYVNDKYDLFEKKYCDLYRWCFNFEPKNRPSSYDIHVFLNYMLSSFSHSFN